MQRWNQVFISLAVQHSVANTETEYAHKMKALLVRTNKVLNGFLEAWCKGVDNKYIQLHRNEIRIYRQGIQSLQLKQSFSSEYREKSC